MDVSSGGFNGAALFRARSDDCPALSHVLSNLASTGPRSFERGVALERELNDARTKLASTGPRSFERGVRR